MGSIKPLNKIVKTFYERMTMKCVFECCDVTGTVEQTELHINECQHNPNRTLKCPKCDSKIPIHEMDSHECISYLVKQLQKCRVEFDPIATVTNEIGNVSRIGTTGKYYCGKRIGFRCCDGNCCDGRCGPTNGCNCLPCMKLDVVRRRLPKGYLVNKEGATCRRGKSGLFYCGRLVMAHDRTTDGHCGPESGNNCFGCGRLDALADCRVEFDPIATVTNEIGNVSRIGTTGKYYCGKRIGFRCCDGNCCDGRCGPTNGCNCLPCMKLDVVRRRLPKGYLVNKEGATCRRGKSGLFYCGRLVMAHDRTTDGHCGPESGNNCFGCGRLDALADVNYIVD